MRRNNTKRLFREATAYFVGGVNSPVRSFTYVGGAPLLLRKGKGAHVYDYDGNKYVDYVLAYGALLLGHAPRSVIVQIQKSIQQGITFGTTHAAEVALARVLQERIPLMKKIRFVNSGTEAVMGALRLARGYTERDIIVMFEGAYHGHADYLLKKAGSGLATLNLSASAGVPRDYIKHTLIAPAHDTAALQTIFKKYGSRIAAVIIEPVGGNHGVIPPDQLFLTYLREITHRYNALLIFDEVITGFRFHCGAAADMFGIVPDLMCLGKIIGGGFPVGAFGGRKDIMSSLAPEGPVYQASTFAGNPIIMYAGRATLDRLRFRKKGYARIRLWCTHIANALREAAERKGIPLAVSSWESLFSIRFDKQKYFKSFYKGLLHAGVYCAPSEYEANFLSFAHIRKDIDITITAMRKALRCL